MKDRELDYLRAWIRKGDNDLKNVELILKSQDEDSPYDTVCFHCQQAVEKYLKAFLTAKGVKFPMTHNLADLIAKCAVLNKSFLNIEIEAELLTPYSVEVRYPDDFYRPSRKDAEEAYNTAMKIKDFVLKRMNV